MKVFIREAAYDDLDRIYAWIAKDEPRLGDFIIERIFYAAEWLGRFPHLGHAGAVPGTYEWVVSALPYIIVYVINGELGVLDIVAIFHGAQNRKEASKWAPWRRSGEKE